MVGIFLVLLSHSITPIRDKHDLEYRYRVAEVVQSVTDDEHEQRLLISIAAHESDFVKSVGTCRRMGDHGKAVTLWQMQVFGKRRHRVCRSLQDGAKEALAMVRYSINTCAELPEEEQLSFYASGSCRKGHRASRKRWVP